MPDRCDIYENGSDEECGGPLFTDPGQHGDPDMTICAFHALLNRNYWMTKANTAEARIAELTAANDALRATYDATNEGWREAHAAAEAENARLRALVEGAGPYVRKSRLRALEEGLRNALRPASDRPSTFVADCLALLSERPCEDFDWCQGANPPIPRTHTALCWKHAPLLSERDDFGKGGAPDIICGDPHCPFRVSERDMEKGGTP